MVDIKRSLKKDNLQTENWFYGGLDTMDYKLQKFELSTKYNLTSCPLEDPFVDKETDECMHCEDGEMFSLKLRKCIICNEVEFLNLETS